MVACNPVGPDAVYARFYRSARAAEGYASPGLSAGWVDIYDVTVQGTSGGWEPLRLVYPNGAVEALVPALAPNGRPTGTLSAPTGAPYRASGIPSPTPGRWLSLRILFGDLSRWTFLPDPQNPDRYLLRQITTGGPNFYRHDADGNATTYAGFNHTYSLTYDEENRPLSIGGRVANAGYRGDGLRGWKQKSGSSAPDLYFLYDGGRLLCEMDNNGVAYRLYLWGANGLVQQYLPANSKYFLNTYDPDGNLVQRYYQDDSEPLSTTLFDYLGVLLRDKSAASPTGNYPPTDPFGYGGQWGLYTELETRSTDTDTGLGFSHAGGYYDPANARFLTRAGGGVNEYSATGSGLGEGALDVLQLGLDVLGFVPVLGEGADALSGGIDLGRGDYVGAALSAASLLPVGGQAAGATKIARRLQRVVPKGFQSLKVNLLPDFAKANIGKAQTKTHITYVFKDAEGKVVYVGRASGFGTPNAVLGRRVSRGHEHWHPELGDTREVVAVQSSKAASQGAEDVWYE